MFNYLIYTFFLITLFQLTQSQVPVLIQDFLQDQNIISDFPILFQPPPIPQNITPKCAIQLNQFYQGLRNKELWAIEMLDAWSKVQSGILRGNIANLGSFDECLKVEHEEIKGKYCLISVDPVNLIQGQVEQLTQQYGANFLLQAAICIPEVCTINDLKMWLDDFTRGNIQFNDDFCQSVSTQPDLQWDSIFVVCVLGFVVIFAVVCTILDILRPNSHAIVKALSMTENARKLFKHSDNPNKMKFLDGLKTISMAWIIFAHGYLLLVDAPMKNYVYAFELLEKLPFMVIISATYSVDTFLIISGFLLSYSIMRAKRINIPSAIFHRYLRLTPVFAVVIMLHSTLFPFFGSGPVYPKHKQILVENCQRYWWSALLYVQNFVNSRNMCVPQSWYLSVDMQLFVVSLFLMMLLKKKLKVGVVLIVLLIFASIAASFSISWIYELPGSIAGFSENRTNVDFFPLYYYQSYTRMAPYLIGLLLGYLLYKIKIYHTKLILRHDISVIIWIIALIILISCTFAGHEKIMLDTHDRLSNAFYLSFSRPAWALAMSWIIFACAMDYGGIINSILSLRIFEIFSRLSYGMYLVHYAIIHLTYLSTRSSIELGIMDQNLRFWGFFTASAVVAVLFSLLFESPVIVLEKIIFKKGRSNVESREDNGKV